MHYIKVCFAIAIAAALSGCTITTYHHGDFHFTRVTIGANTIAPKVTVKIAADGSREFDIDGYNQNQSQAAGTITQGVTAGVIEGLKKIP